MSPAPRTWIARRLLPLAAILLLHTACPRTASGQKYRYAIANNHVSYTYVTSHFDHSGSDYYCGSKRYTGHKGNDYGCGSFAGMDAGRDIVSAVDATVVATNDGEYDRCTTGSCTGGGGFGNYVKLQQSDGKYTYYAHMKKGSVAVSTGQKVTCGQKLGQVGSSGYSTGPHLHFEVRSGSTSHDPYKGSCGGYGYWVSQGAYLSLPGTTCDGPATPTLDAAYVSQGSNARPGSGGAQYSLCPLQNVQLWFSLKNTGTLTWEDTNQSGVAGKAVRLGVLSGTDPLGAPSRVSVSTASDPSVKTGETTKLTINGKAPAKTGVVKSQWRLVSEGVSWFGPVVSLTFNVTETPPGTGGGCNTGQKGECSKGTLKCSGGSVACVATTSPKAEVCDKVDNDCDGLGDENLSRACYLGPKGTAGKGECRAGTQVCAGGIWLACKGQVMPAAEVCDGKDNNCDGNVDESCSCKNGSSQTCYAGKCKGVQRCEGGKWGKCVITPGGKEICSDYLDNDCDGTVDEPDCIPPAQGGDLPAAGGDGSENAAGGMTGGCSCNLGPGPVLPVPAMLLALAALLFLVIPRRRC